MEETYHVLELAPGVFFSGQFSGGSRIRWGSIGVPREAHRVSDRFAETGWFPEVLKVFPEARVVKIRVKYEVLR